MLLTLSVRYFVSLADEHVWVALRQEATVSALALTVKQWEAGESGLFSTSAGNCSSLSLQKKGGGRPDSALCSQHLYNFQSVFSHGKKFTMSLYINSGHKLNEVYNRECLSTCMSTRSNYVAKHSSFVTSSQVPGKLKKA